MALIPQVEIIKLTTHLDERGYFREILKASQFPKFGQWSMSYMHSNTIKAFHCHRTQYDYWFCASGVIKAVVCDLRPVIFSLEFPDLSKCQWGEANGCQEFILGDNQEPKVLVIPPGIAHGLKVLQGPAVLMYITTEEYNPNDEGRIPFDALGYDWFATKIT